MAVYCTLMVLLCCIVFHCFVIIVAVHKMSVINWFVLFAHVPQYEVCIVCPCASI